MNIQMDKRGESLVAIVTPAQGELLIQGPADALSLFADVFHAHACNKLIIAKEAICEDFFSLKTGIAGEVLQKCVNYQMKFAIVGDFSVYSSKSLRDFIYESNRGRHVFFLPTTREALDALHAL